MNAAVTLVSLVNFNDKLLPFRAERLIICDARHIRTRIRVSHSGAGVGRYRRIISDPEFSSVVICVPCGFDFHHRGHRGSRSKSEALLGSGCWSADAWFSQRIGQILKNGTSTML